MWNCKKCGEGNSDDFDVCSQCGAKNSESLPLNVAQEPKALASDYQSTIKNLNPMNCPRCDQPLHYVGTREFHEGPGGGFFSNWSEMFMNKERFDVYVCRRCGRVEFFVDDIGEQFRPSAPSA
jgi:DNA-directed RNA polymerase subunit RPC12/RpoP